MKLAEVADVMAGTAAARLLAPAAGEVEPLGYSIDSRTLRAGELFFAIRGENNDGHAFVGAAFKRGALAAVVDRSFQGGEFEGRLVRVDDTLAALQSLATGVIRSWRGREVAITGSSGKTTTKDITALLLSRFGPVLKSIGNLNNAYGLPLSVLRLESDGKRPWDFEYAVLEMGMNHRGEIARLTEIAPPAIGVVTNVAAVHLEFFDSVDQIAEAKSEMIMGIRPGGEGVLNQDDPRVARMRGLSTGVEFSTFGIRQKADVMAKHINANGLGGTDFVLVTPEATLPARIPLFGMHNLYNALAAATVARLCGVRGAEIVEGLANCAGSKMRGQVLEFKEGFTLVDDSYNSNPTALAALLASFNEAKGRIVAVAGEMLELGPQGPALHREAGRNIARSIGPESGRANTGVLIGVRGLASEIVEGAREAGMSAEATVFAETSEEAGRVLAAFAREGDLILVKGSRGVKTEKVVEIMKQQFTLIEREG
jgi:UDP-N-acetylmuramoyl-tripeptide--D-alanyl-D-alanine ligase